MSAEDSNIKAELLALRQALEVEKQKNQILTNEIRYRLGNVLIDLYYEPATLFKLPSKILSLYKEGKSKQQRSFAQTSDPPASFKSIDSTNINLSAFSYEKDLELYLNTLDHLKTDKPFVFIFSGTIEIQKKRANRPIRQALSLLEDSYPVFFSYFRWNQSDEIPKSSNPLLFQSPIDKTMEKLERIAAFEFKNKRDKIFILSFPFPEAVAFLDYFELKGWKTLYDVRDNWKEFHKVGMAPWYNEDAESFASNRAQLVSCVSSPLREHIVKLSGRKDILVNTNAYDPDFKSPDFRKNEANTEKTIGYFGHLTEKWFDWKFMISLAKKCPDFRFELIGHGHPQNLELPNNLIYLGFMGHDEICKKAENWDLAIIPFKINELSRCVDPIKIYEYLALELPVVSLEMPQIDNYPHVATARTLNQFIKKMKEKLQEDFDTEAVNEWLEKRSWKNNTLSLISNLEKVEPGKDLESL